MPGRAKKAKHSAAQHWHIHFARWAKLCPTGRRRRSTPRRSTGTSILRGGRSYARRGEEGIMPCGVALARPFCAEGEGKSRVKCACQRPEARRWHRFCLRTRWEASGGHGGNRRRRRVTL